jgi:hypothetical protein
MKTIEYIKTKQIQWALNEGDIALVGSQGEKGEQAYTKTENQNLLNGLGAEARKQLGAADGQELSSGKIRAVHSSSAICINVFQYWMDSPDVRLLAAACNLCSSKNTSSFKIRFEEKFPIRGFSRAPNLDVTIRFKEQLVAIESKFTEPYGGRAKGDLSSYLDKAGLWDGLPSIRAIAESIQKTPSTFHFLDAPQLIKHALGLKNETRINKKKLLYLWYGSPFAEGYFHMEEIRKLGAGFEKDGIDFHSITYQEMISKLAKLCRGTAAHDKYIKYITRRYL